MIPNTRDEKVKWIQKKLLPIFDSQLDYSSADDVDQERLERSKEILAEAYLDEAGAGVIVSMFKLTFILFLIDVLTFMPPQVYGLIFTTTGTFIMLVEADILGSEAITARSEDRDRAMWDRETYLDEDKARRLARNTVNTNIGLVWMAVGFSMQILAVWVLPSGTLFQPVIEFPDLL